jgi:hypothetical protein
MPWRLGRWLLVASLVPLVVGVFLLAAPVRNPRVQDCGAPVIFSITGRTNSPLLVEGDVSPGEDLSALRAQTPCNELVKRRMRWGTGAVASFFVLALAGALLGLADDRRQLHHAPQFEALLRERPADAPGEVWDRPVVPRGDIGVALPDVESSDVDAFVVWSVAAVCVLLIVSGIDSAWDALGGLNVAGLVVALILAAVARLAAGSQLACVDTGERSPADRLRRAVPVAVACDWAARVRPDFGTVGVEAHALVRAGVDRARALLDLGGSCTLAAVSHLGLLGLLFLATLTVGGDDGSWPRFPVVLVVIVLAMAVVGVALLSARLRQLPCTLGRPAVDRLVERFAISPGTVALEFALAGALPLVHGAMLWTLTASLGDAPVVPILFWTLCALAFRAWAPVPEGFVAADVVLVIGFSLAGVTPVHAVVSVLLWRVLSTWLPLAPGYLVTRRLVRRGTL